jgi:hypothetical protein
MVGKKVTPNTLSHHNQKNQPVQPKTISCRNKKRHNSTTGMVGEYHLKLFPPQPKTDTTAQLENFSSSPRVASVFGLCPSFCLSVRVMRGI